MSKTIAFMGSAVLFAGMLAGCGEYQECVPTDVDDALILPQAQETRKPSGTSRSNSWSKPSKTKTTKPYGTKTTKHGKGLHWDADDCEWDND